MMLGICVVPERQRRAVGSALYRKFGFEHERTHRAYALRDGVYVDAHAMARLHPNPPRPA